MLAETVVQQLSWNWFHPWSLRVNAHYEWTTPMMTEAIVTKIVTTLQKNRSSWGHPSCSITTQQCSHRQITMHNSSYVSVDTTAKKGDKT